MNSRLNLMRQLRSEGKTYSAIAVQFGISRQRVAQILGRDGQRPNTERKIRWPCLRSMTWWHNNRGRTNTEIARELGCTEWNVAVWRRKMGFHQPSQRAALGDAAELWVFEHLGALGMSVRRMPPGSPYDLLVSGKTRVEVRASHVRGSRHVSWTGLRFPDRADILVLVVATDDGMQAFVVPEAEAGTSIELTWPPGVRPSRYHRFLGAWNVLSRT